jgi:hypothetical protein
LSRRGELPYPNAGRPPPDTETAALADLAERITRINKWFTTALSAAALLATLGAAAHALSGPLAGRNGKQVAAIVLIEVFVVLAAVLVPGFVAHRIVRSGAVRRWKVEARSRFQLDPSSADDLARIFAPNASRTARLVRVASDPIEDEPAAERDAAAEREATAEAEAEARRGRAR